MRGRALRAAMLVATSATGSTAVAQESLRTIEVVGGSPVAGSGVDLDKIPSDVVRIGPSAFSHTKTPDLIRAIRAMMQGIPLVAPSDRSGNQFQINLDDRGFSASSVQGASQGIAVYQSGVCLNEVYGDVVNWDFIREMAINRTTPMPNNPLFGLNAIGRAFPSI
jgi:iron complex outermembrane recepter protein